MAGLERKLRSNRRAEHRRQGASDPEDDGAIYQSVVDSTVAGTRMLALLHGQKELSSWIKSLQDARLCIFCELYHEDEIVQRR